MCNIVYMKKSIIIIILSLSLNITVFSEESNTFEQLYSNVYLNLFEIRNLSVIGAGIPDYKLLVLNEFRDRLIHIKTEIEAFLLLSNERYSINELLKIILMNIENILIIDDNKINLGNIIGDLDYIFEILMDASILYNIFLYIKALQTIWWKGQGLICPDETEWQS